MMNIDEAVEVSYMDNLDNTIDYLKKAKENNENVYIDFNSENGVIRLYSADIDVDTAYQRIYGLTKEEKENYESELNSASNKEEVHAKYQNLIAVYFDMLRDNSTKLDYKITSASNLIKTLKECKKLNKNIYIDYDSTDSIIPIRFYSMDLDIDRAFLSIMGLTKSQYSENKERIKMIRNSKELNSAMDDFI